MAKRDHLGDFVMPSNTEEEELQLSLAIALSKEIVSASNNTEQASTSKYSSIPIQQPLSSKCISNSIPTNEKALTSKSDSVSLSEKQQETSSGHVTIKLGRTSSGKVQCTGVNAKETTGSKNGFKDGVKPPGPASRRNKDPTSSHKNSNDKDNLQTLEKEQGITLTLITTKKLCMLEKEHGKTTEKLQTLEREYGNTREHMQTLEQEHEDTKEKLLKAEKEVDDFQDQRVCKICWDMIRELAFVPCGHIFCCSKCVKNINPKICPICERKFRSTQRVYWS